MANANLFHDLAEKYGFPEGKFVRDMRFEILGLHSTSQLKPTASIPRDHDGYSTYIAYDKVNSKCVLLRIHGVRASTIPEMENERRILEMLNRHSEASSHILMPLETFWIDGSTDRHLCWVLEFIGPDFQFMADVCGPEDDLYPAAMVWQLAKQALESLSFLHAKGVCHGYLQRASLVLTYTFIDASNRDEVMRFYGQPSAGNGIEKLNETSTDKEGAPDRLDFRLKLTHLWKAFSMTEAKDGNGVLDLVHFTAPPPELLFDHIVQPSVDVWDLAVLLTDIAAGQYEFANLLSGPKGDSQEKLCHTRRFLGQLPSKYLERLPHGQQTIAEFDENALYAAVTENPFKGETEVFSDEEYQLLISLLRKMLMYDSEKRYTADQALKDEFFKVKRPVKDA